MKICQLLHAMTTGGAEVLADRMGRAFAERHRITFACLDGVGELGEQLRSDGFDVCELGRGPGFDFGCVRRLARFLRDRRIDVIHAHQYTPFFYAAAARKWGRHSPIVFTEHGRFFPDLPSRKRAVYNRLMLGRRDRVVAVGEDVKRALIENESLPAGRIEVIYNGINLEPFAGPRDDAERSWLRRELGIPTEAIVIAQVARLDSIKDHLTAVRAMSLAESSAPGLHLAIVGEGPARAMIEAEIEKLDLRGRVHLMGLRRDVPSILRGSDIALLTSVSEGIPLTLIEGMACGLPCVSTDVGGIREVVEDGRTGLLCPVGEPGAIAAALGRLAGDRRLRGTMGAAGRDTAESRFSERQMIDRYEELFSSYDSARLSVPSGLVRVP